MDPSWTTEQKHAYTTARDWARRQLLLPWAVADTYATWYATVGRNLFRRTGGRLPVVDSDPRVPQAMGPMTEKFQT